MSTIELTGHSDDLIEIEGALREEFTYTDADNGDLVAFGDGTVLRIRYTDSGVWRITPVKRGSATLRIEQAVEDDDDNYTDKATLDGDVTWVVHGIAMVGS